MKPTQRTTTTTDETWRARERVDWAFYSLRVKISELGDHQAKLNIHICSPGIWLMSWGSQEQINIPPHVGHITVSSPVTLRYTHETRRRRVGKNLQNPYKSSRELDLPAVYASTHTHTYKRGEEESLHLCTLALISRDLIEIFHPSFQPHHHHDHSPSFG